MAKKEKFTFIDLFAGIGGFHLAMESVGGRCVFASEWDKCAQETYRTNFPNTPLYGDITKEETKRHIPDNFDVLCAGFPCQPFSHAGLKKGIEDTRGTLFYDIAKILKQKKPKVAFLENVRGLISHNNGDTLRVILSTLTDIGYKCIIDKKIIKKASLKEFQEETKKMMLRARDFGVCQNRQRIYIVLWRKDLDVNFVYPKPLHTPTRVGDILDKNAANKYTISDKLWLGHQRRKTENDKAGKGFGYGLVNEDSSYANTISARYYKDGSEILIEQKGKNPRKLTPREALRLQGFPDTFIMHSSEVQVYKQAGNSVAVPVIKALSGAITTQLLGVKNAK